MATTKLMSLCTISCLLILLCSPISPSFANLLTDIFNTPDTVCSYTLFPGFCKSILPYNKPCTIHDYTKISLQQSLSHTQKFLSLFDFYLKLPSTMYKSTIVALQDCYFLAQGNVDLLSKVSETYSDNLQSLKVDDLHTFLSATLTNHETCMDGLQAATYASSIKNNLLASLSDGTMHYSVALALFTHGWGHTIKKGRYLAERKHVFWSADHGAASGGRLPLTMSRKDKQRYESVTGRRLLRYSSAPNKTVMVSQMVVVDPYGSGDFVTISDAVAAAPNNTNSSNGYFAIYVVAGIYNEYVSIPKNKCYLMMIGAGINRTVVTGNRSVVDGSTTFNSSTFAVVGQGFVAVNITFRNTAGAIKHQAVAVRNGADFSTFYMCSFEGYQDTLYTHSLRQFYRECDIYGTVDYIFGNAAVVFQNCRIYSRLPMPGQFNTVTAQGRTDPNQNTGTSIHNCTIKAADDLASSNGTTQTYLGRPWKEYSRTVVMQSFIDSLINPAGWAAWSGDFALNTSYYAEFNNTGPGSNTTNRVTWPGYHVINATDAANFTVRNFIQGDYWLPMTGLPYVSGLLY